MAQVALALNQRSRFEPATSSRRFVLAMTDVGEVYFMPTLIERCRQRFNRFKGKKQVPRLGRNGGREDAGLVVTHGNSLGKAGILLRRVRICD